MPPKPRPVESSPKPASERKSYEQRLLEELQQRIESLLKDGRYAAAKRLVETDPFLDLYPSIRREILGNIHKQERLDAIRKRQEQLKLTEPETIEAFLVPLNQALEAYKQAKLTASPDREKLEILLKANPGYITLLLASDYLAKRHNLHLCPMTASELRDYLSQFILDSKAKELIKQIIQSGGLLEEETMLGRIETNLQNPDYEIQIRFGQEVDIEVALEDLDVVKVYIALLKKLEFDVADAETSPELISNVNQALERFKKWAIEKEKITARAAGPEGKFPPRLQYVLIQEVLEKD